MCHLGRSTFQPHCIPLLFQKCSFLVGFSYFFEIIPRELPSKLSWKVEIWYVDFIYVPNLSLLLFLIRNFNSRHLNITRKSGWKIMNARETAKQGTSNIVFIVLISIKIFRKSTNANDYSFATRMRYELRYHIESKKIK